MDKKFVDLGTGEIKRLLSNRYPYLLIDKVTEIVPGERASGYKNLTANEWFFPVHFPEEPMMPGMIQMEALLQMLSLTVLSLEGNAGKPVLGLRADHIRLKRHVVPGSRLDIKAVLTSWNGEVATGWAEGTIGGETACSAEFTFSIQNREGDGC